jgi:hypothetical protein
VLLMIRLFVPILNPFFKLLALSLVPHQRLIIGLGVLSIIQTVLVIRWLSAKTKARDIPISWVALYSVLVLVFELLLNFHIQHISPGYIGHYRLILFSLPVPAIVYLLLVKRYDLGIGLFTLFCVFTCFMVNPLYRGTDVLTKTPLSSRIKDISSHNEGKWISEGLTWENFPQMNGAPSLSGTYAYPQLKEWSAIDHGTQEYIYNRYAHVEFVVDRRSSNDSTRLELVGQDHIKVITTTCSTFLKNNDVHYLLTESKLGAGAGCAKLLSAVNYPAQSFYIYRLN